MGRTMTKPELDLEADEGLQARRPSRLWWWLGGIALVAAAVVATLTLIDSDSGDTTTDAVAALSSLLMLTLQRFLKPIGMPSSTEEMILDAESGKLVFVDLGTAFLAVVTRANRHLDSGMVEIRSVARKLRERCVMS